MQFPYMSITYNKAKFRIQVFVEIPQENEKSIADILNQFQEAGYHCKLAKHKNFCWKEGISLDDYPEEIFPEAVFTKEGRFSHYTGRIGYFINMQGGYYYMPSKKDPTRTRFQTLEFWIAKLNRRRAESLPQVVDHPEPKVIEASEPVTV